MTIPFKCPVCDGQGLVNKPPYIAGDQQTWATSETGPYTCHACGGSGIIWGESNVVYGEMTEEPNDEES